MTAAGPGRSDTGMAKKAGGAPKATAPVKVWAAEHPCTRRGCGQVHRVCIEAEKAPAAADWFAYTCPKVHMPQGFQFADLK